MVSMSVLLKIDIDTNEKIDNSCIAHAQRSRFNIRLRYRHKTEQTTSSGEKKIEKREMCLYFMYQLKIVLKSIIQNFKILIKMSSILLT